MIFHLGRVLNQKQYIIDLIIVKFAGFLFYLTRTPAPPSLKNESKCWINSGEYEFLLLAPCLGSETSPQYSTTTKVSCNW